MLACAGVLNHADNITYLDLARGGLNEVPDGSVNVTSSIAVLQHLTTARVDDALAWVFRKLVPGGTAVFHVVLEDDAQWRSEAAWTEDRSAKGRLRYRFGLHCFARPGAWYLERFAAHGCT